MELLNDLKKSVENNIDKDSKHSACNYRTDNRKDLLTFALLRVLIDFLILDNSIPTYAHCISLEAA